MSRLTRLPLVASDGEPVGAITDVVLVPSGADPARVLGFVATVQRRRIFVNGARVSSIDPTGVRLRSGTIDVRPFRKRTGEQLVVSDLFGQRVGDDFLTDVAIEFDPTGRQLVRRQRSRSAGGGRCGGGARHG